MGISKRISLYLALASLALASVPASATFPGANGRIAWSRDGDIFTMRPDGSGKLRVTRSRRFETAQWSPDGRTLAVVRERARMEQRVQIVVMGARGSNPRLVARARHSVQGLRWSPDGTHLVYCDLGIDDPDASSPYPSAIKVVDVAAGTEDALTEFSERACSPSWSPDGTRIAFAQANPADPDEVPVNIDIYVMDADGSNVQPVLEDASQRQLDPVWSPTGDEIVFSRPVLAPDGQGDERAVLEKVAVDGTGRVVLTDPTDAYDQMPAWSPDGSRLLFIRTDAFDFRSRLGVVNADGTGEELLTRSDFSAVWSPDSTRIAFFRNGDIFTIRADGGRANKIAGKKGRFEAAPSWKAR